jgi:hypothetical protein
VGTPSSRRPGRTSRGRASLAVVAGAAVLALGLLSGCGDGTRDGTEAAAPPTPARTATGESERQATALLARFYTQADELCTTSLRRLEAGPAHATSVTRAARDAARIQHDTLVGLKAIRPPRSVRRDYQVFLRAMVRRNRATVRFGRLIRTDEVRAAGRAGDAMNEEIAIAKRWGQKIGFTVCPGL